MFAAMLTQAPPKPHRNRVQCIVAHLTGRIEAGSLVPGARLPTEVEIMRILGVGRSAVREAMSQLQAAGLVETRHGVGTFVLVPRDVAALLELRVGVEADAAALAAERRSNVQLALLRASLDSFADNARSNTVPATPEIAFHLLVAQSAGNRYFHDILAHLVSAVVPQAPLDMTLRDPGRDMDRVIYGREAIYSAIAQRDAETARAAMRKHLTGGCARMFSPV